MFHKSLLFLSLILTLPVTVFSQNSNEYLIAKKKLTCLYQRIDDDYLKREFEPVMVILESDCLDLRAKIADGIRSMNPPKPPGVIVENDENATLTADDFYMMTKQQLECFKKKYEASIRDDASDLISINLEKICEY